MDASTTNKNNGTQGVVLKWTAGIGSRMKKNSLVPEQWDYESFFVCNMNLWNHVTKMGLWMVLKSGKHLKLDNEIFKIYILVISRINMYYFSNEFCKINIRAWIFHYHLKRILPNLFIERLVMTIFSFVVQRQDMKYC